MIKTIKFEQLTWRDSWGRNGLIRTHGIELFSEEKPRDYDNENAESCVLLSPITSRGHSSESCRIAIAHRALPEVIAALQAIYASVVEF